MKIILQKLILVISLSFFVSVVNAQLVYINDTTLIENLKVKNRKTILYRSEDTTGQKGKVFKETSFIGTKPTKDYFYIFFDVVPYSHTTVFSYNDRNQIIEVLRTQSIIQNELTESSKGYLTEADMQDSYTKMLYFYDKQGNLIQEKTYSYGGSIIGVTNFDVNDPSEVVNYEYDKGLLIKEVGMSGASFQGHKQTDYSSSSDYITTYVYDNNQQLTKKITSYHTFPNKPELVTTYLYDKIGNKIEEKQTGGLSGVSNKHTKYEYDQKGRVTKELNYSQVNDTWIENIFEYNNGGNQIPKDTDDTYQFYDNGLLRQRIVKIRNSVYNFITTYDYYE